MYHERIFVGIYRKSFLQVNLNLLLNRQRIVLSSYVYTIAEFTFKTLAQPFALKKHLQFREQKFSICRTYEIVFQSQKSRDLGAGNPGFGINTGISGLLHSRLIYVCVFRTQCYSY